MATTTLHPVPDPRIARWDRERRLDEEIRARRKEVDYDTRDFTVEHVVRKFQEDEIFRPEYQREFIWTKGQQSKLVESVLIGLPIPMMFFADLADGRLEIVDGVQRVQTLVAFLEGDLVLEGLQRLPSLNDLKYTDLPLQHQRKFRSQSLRIVVLDDTTTDETRREIFARVNTTGQKVRPSEVRRGAWRGPFVDLLKRCARSERFQKLCPISESQSKRREDEELVLRFFAYAARYRKFEHDVEKFLDRFVQEHQDADSATIHAMEQEFQEMLRFVERAFPEGFRKSATARTTPRVRFEAIAVGTILAIRKRPDLEPPENMDWLESEEFRDHVTTHASNSGLRLRGRVEYVRDRLLKGR